MPVTKESGYGEAKTPDQTQDDKSPAVEHLPEEKIHEKKEDSETKKETLPQQDENVPKEQICNPPSAKLATEARDDTGVVEKSEITDSGIARSEISITMTNAPSEVQQFGGTIETGRLSPSGDGINSPDITTSSLSICTQSEPNTELDTQSGQGSSLQCRNCKNMYTSSEDKPASCSDLCPFCTATTYSPLLPRIPQPMGNPVKNQNIDTQLDIELQSEDETRDPVVAVGVGEPERPSQGSSPPSGGSPPSAGSHTPGGIQQQRDPTIRRETLNNETRQQRPRSRRPRCSIFNVCCCCNCCEPSSEYLVANVLMAVVAVALVMGLVQLYTESSGSSLENSSKPPSDEAPDF